MKLNYRQRLSLWFIVIFAVFTAVVIVFEQTSEREFKTEALQARLDAYADVADAALSHGGSPDSLMALLPGNIRLTQIDRHGNVLYDNATHISENHAGRPEIIAAREHGTGSSIRVSASNSKEYLYYAKRFNPYYIRVALPYDIQVRHFLQAGNLFLYYIILLFVVILLMINYVSGRFGQSIRRLKDFATLAGAENKAVPDMAFPEDELGEIGARIAESYRQLEANRRVIALEREKLLQHVHSSEEGICFYASGGRAEFYNGLYIQYLNTMTDGADGTPASLFTEPVFERVQAFLANPGTNYLETKITRQGKHFSLRVNMFEDGSFEIAVNDITRQERTRILKQEMTGNIAHELRTPVTTIRGYLETMLERPLDDSRRQDFLLKAHNQAVALSELIQDVSLIARIEEAPQSFRQERVDIRTLLEGLQNDLSDTLEAGQITFDRMVPANVAVQGNYSLLYSVFRNLTENVIRHAGAGTRVHVTKYNEDTDFYYFSFADNGVGIPDEQHLSRIFERFYRTAEGRTRDTGGSGLGLSIVRNAVAFHRGTIMAKNVSGGGLEFLFNLPKAKPQ